MRHSVWICLRRLAKRDKLHRRKNTSLIVKAKNVEVQRREVQKQISRILLSHSIDTSSEIKFTYEGGKISVDGSHPQKDTIERILNENTELRSAVSGLLSDSHELAAAKVQQEYTVALEDDDDEDKENWKRKWKGNCVCSKRPFLSNSSCLPLPPISAFPAARCPLQPWIWFPVSASELTAACSVIKTLHIIHPTEVFHYVLFSLRH
ncbi:MAG: hypothetical protein ACLU99_07235 [Alphaproteobacteria bacterium]